MSCSTPLPMLDSRRRMPDPRRWLLAGAGVVSTAIGAIGVVVPGLPTTIFLIVASFCFARSCPWLEQRLLRTKLFAPYMPWVDGTAPLSRRAKVAAIATMWTAVTGSLVFLALAGRLGPWTGAIVPLTALAGTAAIAGNAVNRLRRRADARAAGARDLSMEAPRPQIAPAAED
jgi:hypothetical protein